MSPKVPAMRKSELAALMQTTEATEMRSYLEADPGVVRGGGVAVRTIAGVICLGMRAMDDGFLNRALGFGTVAEATPALLARIERHYASLGHASRITVADRHTPRAAIRMLERSGYEPLRESVEWIYGYDRARPPKARSVPGLEIERIGAADAETYAALAFESFSERGEMFRTIVAALIRRRARGRRLAVYLGRVDGELAATGMLFDVRPVGGLGNGSVRRKFRGRGIQGAMIAHRMRIGWERGLRLFFAQTQNGASAHNMEELGWRKLYDEIDWVKA